MLSVSYVCRGVQFSQSAYDDNRFQMAGVCSWLSSQIVWTP